jgi:tRNA A22 N-methylase
MPSALTRFKQFFKIDIGTSSIKEDHGKLHHYLLEHHQLSEIHTIEIASLMQQKKEATKSCTDTELNQIAQQYNLKLLRLLAQQKYEREEFNRSHCNIN